MSKIIKFPDKNAPDSDFIYEENGTTWFKYGVSYTDGDKEFCFSIWATSFDDAERRIKLPMKIDGQIISEE